MADEKTTPTAATKTDANEHYDKSYYRKGGIAKWILLYLLIGAVIYGVIYYFFFMQGSSSLY